jgi:hypothetical protein
VRHFFNSPNGLPQFETATLVPQNIFPTVKRFARLLHYLSVVVLTSDWESRWPNPGDGAALVPIP